MQPEDIIQAKEWEQLSEEEKRIVAPLASTKGEYGMLKKMLLLVQEDALDVPRVSLAVQQQLQKQLPSSKPSKLRLLWYVAAASVLALVVAGYILLVPQEQDEMAVAPIQKPVEKGATDTAKQAIPQQEPSLPADEPGSLAKKPGPRKKLQVDSKSDLAKPVYTAQTSTAIHDNIALLDLVTEVY